MTQKNNRKAIRQRSAWIASMVACFCFLLMAVKLYDIPVSDLLGNLSIMILGLLLIIAVAAVLGRVIALLRKRR